MKQPILKTEPRNDSPKKLRAQGLIPGVLHGPGTTSVPVQFERSAFIRILSKHGSNAKIWIERGKEKSFGLIKEIQRDPLDKSIVHVTVHLVASDKEMKMLVPIIFTGREELENRILMLQPIKEHVEMSGKAAAIPESIAIDVSKKELGDTITRADIQVEKDIQILDLDSEVYALIKDLRHAAMPEEETEAEDKEETSTGSESEAATGEQETES